MVRKLGMVAGLAILFTSFLLIFTNVNVFAANEINRLDVDVTLEADGSARIVETWDMSNDEGTEVYKPLEIESAQELTDFEVKMDGQPFQPVGTWDIEADFAEKAGTFGQNGNELNWGITDYGDHTYDVAYTISNFVTQTETEQMIFWKFINDSMDPAPENISVTISSKVAPFNLETNRIWAFGFGGRIDITDGRVVAASDTPLTGENYATLLVRIPANTYPTAFTVDRTFDSFVQQAFEGSSYNWEDYNPNATYEELTADPTKSQFESFLDRTWQAIKGFVFAIGALLVALVSGWGMWRSIQNSRLLKKYYPPIKELEKRLDGQYYREQPLPNVTHSYAVLEEMKVSEMQENYLTAGLLSLVKDGYLSIHQETESRMFGRDKEVTFFQLTDKREVPWPLDKLYYLLQRIGAGDGRITQDDFAEYVKKNPDNYLSYFSHLQRNSKDYLLENGYTQELLIAKSRKEKTELDIANELNEFAYTDRGFAMRDNHVKFKNYLLDFSLLNERDAVEVNLWQELMVYAAAFGVTDQVEKEFAKIYPNFTEEMPGYNGIPIHTFLLFSHHVDHTYQQAVASESSSSGGGGFSSFGGGGGSFGGGSGGGTR